MGIGNFFAKINDFLETKYEAVSDFLTKKGIPLQKYNDFLESKGIPAMWFNFFLILIIIAIIIFLSLLIFKSSVVIHATFVDDSGNSLQNVYLTLNINEVSKFSGTTNDGDIKLENVGVGDSVSVSATLSGYTLVSPSTFVITGKDQFVKFILSKEIQSGDMSLRLLDKETQTVVAGADVNIIDPDTGEVLFSGVSENDGSLKVRDVPLGTILSIKVNKDGYLDFDNLQPADTTGVIDIELEPQAISSGEKGTITFNVESMAQPIEDVKVSLYDASTKQLLTSDVTDAEGKAVLNIIKGRPLRYVVSKEGFVTVDSQDKNENITLRGNTETVNINLVVGGSNLTVIVKDDSGTEISGANVALYSENGLIIDTNTTNIYGQVDFSGLDVKRGAYVSAYAVGNYYPDSKYIDPNVPGNIVLTLKKIDITSAARVNIFAATKDNKPVANATVQIYEMGEKNLPLYLPNATTSITGLYTTLLEPGTNIRVNVQSKDLFGTKDASLVSGDNKIEIYLTPNQGTNKLYVYGVNGSPLVGAKLTIRANTQMLFDGNTGSKGNVEFSALGNKEVEVTIVDNSGNVYNKLVEVKDVMEINLSAQDISKNPQISFVGIYDVYGNKLNAVKVNSTYYFKYRVVWPKNQTWGLAHIRLGETNIPGMSMDYGILGVDAISSTQQQYGLYYTEGQTSSVKDLSEFGRPGLKNKWVNVIYKKPTGSTELKVKVRVDKASDLNKIPMYYRADSYDGASYHLDPAVDTNNFSSQLQELHSLAHKEIINVYPSVFECSSVSNICYSYKFIDAYLSYPNFSAVLNQTYAIEFDFFSPNNVSTNIDFNATSKLYTVALNNISDDLIDFVPTGDKSYSLQYNLVLNAGKHKKFRVYFTPQKVGTGSINMNSKLVGINKNFDFKIENQKALKVSLNQDGLIQFGKPVIFNVSDSWGKVSNAIITINDDKGAVSLFVQGNNTKDNGIGGVYNVGAIPAGLYNYEVRAAQHATFRGNFVVTRFGVLSVKPEYEIRIPKGKKTREFSIPVTNISNLIVSSLQYKVLRNNANAFAVKYRFTRVNLPAQTSANLILDVSTDTNNVVYGDEDLVISGTINNNEVVRQLVHLTFVSNTDLDSKCLVVVPGDISINLYDTQRQKFAGVLNLTNKCETDIVNLTPKLIFRDTNKIATYLDFSARTVNIKRGQQVQLNYSMVPKSKVPSQGLKSELFFDLDTGYFQKLIPLHLTILHSTSTIFISTPNPQLILTGNQVVRIPLFIQNLGNTVLRNVSVMIQPYNSTYLTGIVPFSNTPNNAYYNPQLNGPQVRTLSGPYGQLKKDLSLGSVFSEQGVFNASQTYIKPQVIPTPAVLTYILPKQTGLSMLTLKAPSPTTSNAIGAFTVVVKAYNTVDSQYVVASTPIFLSVSSPKCLKLNAPTQGLYFRSSKLDTTITNKNLSITNQCAEPVKIDLPISKKIGSNSTLDISMENTTIMPKQTLPIYSKFYAGDAFNSNTQQVKFVGQGTATGTPYMVNINYVFVVGKSALQKYGNPVGETEIPICGTKDSETIHYPKIGQDCGSEYCDGQTATQYLMGKIRDYIKLYKNISSKYSKNLKTTSCQISTGSCGFDSLGVDATPFVMYMMHDRVSEDYLQTLLKGTELKIVQTPPMKDFDIVEQSKTQFNKLFLDSDFAGCGKYTVQLQGAFAVNSGIAQSGSYSIYVKVDREDTEECKPEVQNAGLYLPKDSKTKTQNTFGFIPTYVNYDKSPAGFTDFAKEVSKQLFGQERLASRKPNTLFLEQATLKDRPMDVELKTDNSNTQVIFTFDSSIDVTKSKHKQDAIKLIQNFLKSNIVPDCLSKDHKQMRIRSSKAETSGQYAITGCKKISAVYGPQTCEFVVAGPVAGYAKLLLSPETPEGYTARVLDADKKQITSVSTINGHQQKYTLEVNFTDPNAAITMSKTSPLKIILKPNGGGDKEITVNFIPCGVSPVKFLNGVINSDLKNSQYFAQIYWQGGKDSKDRCEVIKNVAAKNKKVYIEARDCSVNNTKPLANNISAHILPVSVKAAVASLVACVGTDWATSYKDILGPFGWTSSLINCGLIAGSLFTTSMYANHRTNVALGLPDSKYGTIDKIHDYLAKIKVIGPLLFDTYPKTEKGTTNQEIKNKLSKDNTSYVGAAVLGAAQKLATPQFPKSPKKLLFWETKTVENPITAFKNSGPISKFNETIPEAIKNLSKNPKFEFSGVTDAKSLFTKLKADKEFKDAYRALSEVANKSGYTTEKYYLAHLDKQREKIFNDLIDNFKAASRFDTFTKINSSLTEATKQQDNLKTEIENIKNQTNNLTNDAKNIIEKNLSKKKVKNFSLDNTKQVNKVITNLPDNQKKVIKDLKNHFDEASKNMAELQDELSTVNSEVKDLTKQLKGVSQSAAKELDVTKKEIEDAANKIPKKGIRGSKWARLGEGLLKGAFTAAAADAAYKYMWENSMDSSLNNADVKDIIFKLPPNFTKQNSYVLKLSKPDEGKYTANVTSTESSNLSGFCDVEKGYLNKGYMPKGEILKPSEKLGKTSTVKSGNCNDFSRLLRKYGAILSRKTDGYLDAKNLASQIYDESKFDPNAHSGTSAIGLAQLTQGTFCTITKMIAHGNYDEFVKKFDMDLLREKYRVDSFSELYNRTCPIKIQGLEGGLFCPASKKNNCPRPSLDPRTIPELSIMYSAIYLSYLYDLKGKHLKQIVGSYVVGPYCVNEQNEYINSTTCKSNLGYNSPITDGSYWKKYNNFLHNSAENCVGSGNT